MPGSSIFANDGSNNPVAAAPPEIPKKSEDLRLHIDVAGGCSSGGGRWDMGQATFNPEGVPMPGLTGKGEDTVYSRGAPSVHDVTKAGTGPVTGGPARSMVGAGNSLYPNTFFPDAKSGGYLVDPTNTNFPRQLSGAPIPQLGAAFMRYYEAEEAKYKGVISSADRKLFKITAADMADADIRAAAKKIEASGIYYKSWGKEAVSASQPTQAHYNPATGEGLSPQAYGAQVSSAEGAANAARKAAAPKAASCCNPSLKIDMSRDPGLSEPYPDEWDNSQAMLLENIDEILQAKRIRLPVHDLTDKSGPVLSRKAIMDSHTGLLQHGLNPKVAAAYCHAVASKNTCGMQISNPNLSMYPSQKPPMPPPPGERGLPVVDVTPYSKGNLPTELIYQIGSLPRYNEPFGGKYQADLQRYRESRQRRGVIP